MRFFGMGLVVVVMLGAGGTVAHAQQRGQKLTLCNRICEINHRTCAAEARRIVSNSMFLFKRRECGKNRGDCHKRCPR